MIKKFSSYVLGVAFVLGVVIAGNSAANAQVMTKVEKQVVGTTKKVYNKSKAGVKRGYRVGHQVGGRVWTGSKWVARNSWKGGTWVAVKTANGTKWVYRKATGKSNARRP